MGGRLIAVVVATINASACSSSARAKSAEEQGNAPGTSMVPSEMARIGTVDERYQSFNLEMVEVTGGRFWKSYREIDTKGAAPSSSKPAADVPAGMDPALYEYRQPIDLTNPRLRVLAAALGPAYVRVSGTWANTTYFHDSDAPPPSTPPKGFGAVLTRQQWKGVVDFSRAVEMKIVTSFATGIGTRDARGVWTPREAEKLVSFTKSIGGSIAAAEFMNEPTYAQMGGAPKGYDAAAYARDIAAFRRFMKKATPDTTILGPGGVGEGLPHMRIGLAGDGLGSEDLLKATGAAFDAFSYHSYGATSRRCAALGPSSQVTAEEALSEEYLSRASRIEAFYAALRDRYEPGKPIWLTETADAACGGNPWASTFLDSFRYLDQLGRLAASGVRVHMHNTLAASDYGLLDGDTFEPRPNYWAALLWRRLMGAVVLDPGPAPAPNLHLYAHCLRGVPGGVVLLAINLDRAKSQSLHVSGASQRYTLGARKLIDKRVQMNGRDLASGAHGELPTLAGTTAEPGPFSLAPTTITFLAIPEAGNKACR
jgi:hypothetical protein